jgi:hypothetical protein
MSDNRKFYDPPIMYLWAIITIAIALLIVYLGTLNIITSGLVLSIFVILAFTIGVSIWNLKGRRRK